MSLESVSLERDSRFCCFTLFRISPAWVMALKLHIWLRINAFRELRDMRWILIWFHLWLLLVSVSCDAHHRAEYRTNSRVSEMVTTMVARNQSIWSSWQLIPLSKSVPSRFIISLPIPCQIFRFDHRASRDAHEWFDCQGKDEYEQQSQTVIISLT
jgi:hypothetical protein